MLKLAPLFALLPAAALAHPGHGEASAGHWLMQGDHLVVLALAAIVAAEATRRGVRALRRRGAKRREA